MTNSLTFPIDVTAELFEVLTEAVGALHALLASREGSADQLNVLRRAQELVLEVTELG